MAWWFARELMVDFPVSDRAAARLPGLVAYEQRVLAVSESPIDALLG